MVTARIISVMALCFARSIASEAPLLQTVEGSIKMPPNSLPFPLTKVGATKNTHLIGMMIRYRYSLLHSFA
jgi:hypothetical protein